MRRLYIVIAGLGPAIHDAAAKLARSWRPFRPKARDYFHGKTIIIAGTAIRVGRATAKIFAREGANVVCADVTENAVKETVAQVNAADSQALALAIDVTKRAAVEDMAAREFARQGIRALSISPGPIGTAFAAAAGASLSVHARKSGHPDFRTQIPAGAGTTAPRLAYYGCLQILMF